METQFHVLAAQAILLDCGPITSQPAALTENENKILTQWACSVTICYQYCHQMPLSFPVHQVQPYTAGRP